MQEFSYSVGTMKLYFTKTDSIYKIFTTLEKVSKGKEIEVFIEPGHALFDNLWRGKQLKEIVEDRALQAVFLAKNSQSQEYYKQVGLAVEVIKQRNIEKLFSFISLFLFDIKKFHLHAYETKKYLFGLMIGLEILVAAVFLFLFISLIFPSAVIELHPAEERERIIYNFRYYPQGDPSFVEESRFLNIPYYTGSLNYRYDVTTSVANLQYFLNPAKGKIKVMNTLPFAYSLVGNTQFVTEDGLIFRALQGFELAT